MRQNVKRAARNQGRRTVVKGKVRKLLDAIGAKDAAAADKAFREVAQTLDRGALRHALHRNTAARRKSRLAKRVNAIKAAGKK